MVSLMADTLFLRVVAFLVLLGRVKRTMACTSHKKSEEVFSYGKFLLKNLHEVVIKSKLFSETIKFLNFCQLNLFRCFKILGNL